MEYINLESLIQRSELIESDFNSKTPFRYTFFENFFKTDKAELIHNAYPKISDGKWDGTTYIDQKNKFRKTTFEKGSLFDRVFKELNSAEFVKWLEQVTGIEGIVGDSGLFGGGLHQSITGAHLNVHVDYNFHPTTKYHRRVNVLVYLNKDWKEEYEGYLELWSVTSDKRELFKKFAPTFNRCVIFETNEISFHGHPKPLNTPVGVNRKSIATYYYTATRPDSEIAIEHNTAYVNTDGISGQLKRFISGVIAFLERINKSKSH